MNLMEITIILAVGLIVFGPEELPHIARKAGKFIFELRQLSLELTKEFQNSINQPMEEISKTVKEPLQDISDTITQPINEVTKTINDFENHINETLTNEAKGKQEESAGSGKELLPNEESESESKR